MANLLCIETSSRVCSVGIVDEGKLLSIQEDHSTNYSHSAVLTVFIEKVLKESGLTAKDLEGVAVSQGPGSYTGLRIGVSVAKGVCYALDIPLMAIDTLQAMASLCLDNKAEALNASAQPELPLLLCPMIDARRMEVYYALFDAHLHHVETTQAKVVEAGSFDEWLNTHRVVFFGDGAAKSQPLLQHPNAIFFEDVFPSVKGMLAQATEKFKASAFVDVAYFEPYYLKDFVAGIPKVKGLYR